MRSKNQRKSKKKIPNEQLIMSYTPLPWYADIVNFLACKVLPPELNSQLRKKFIHDGSRI